MKNFNKILDNLKRLCYTGTGRFKILQFSEVRYGNPLVSVQKGIGKLNFEKSCGAIVYRKFHGNTEILLIRHIKSGYWSFPKGHIEQGETEEQTALREIKEETGLDVFVDTGFREKVTFSPRRDTAKTVVYFVARAKNYELKPQEGEISEIKWVEIDKASAHLTYDNDRLIVAKAKAFIALMK